MKRKSIIAGAAFLWACLAVFVVFAQLPQATIAGTLYLPTGAVAPRNTSIVLVAAQVPGELVVNVGRAFYTDANGAYSFSVPRNSTIWVYANARGLNTNGAAGVALSVPNGAGPYDLADLATLPSVPSTGLTVKNESVALANLIGTFDFIGSGVDVAPGVAGVATVTITSGGVTDATYITQTAHASLSAEQALSSLSTGLVKVTNGTGVLSTAGASDLPSGIDAIKLADGSVSNAEFQYLGSVTSDLQTQINSRLTQAAADLLYSAVNHNHTGTYQPLDATLTGLAGVTVAADKVIYATGSDTFAVADLSAFGRSLIDDANVAAAQATLNLVPGTHVQAFNQNLADIAILSDPNADRLLFWDDSAGAWKHLTLGTNLSITDTTLNASGGGGGATVALDNLASVAINTSLISDTDNTDNLGSASKKWQTGYFGTSVNIGGFYLQPSSINGSTLSLLAGDFNTPRSMLAYSYRLGPDDSNAFDAGIDRDISNFTRFMGPGGGAGGFTLNEMSSNPASPTQDNQIHTYVKADKLVIQFDNGGTTRYFTLDLTQSGATPAWAQSTSAP